MSMKDFLDSAVKSLAIITAIAAAGKYFYDLNLQDQRAARTYTLAQIEQYSRGDISASKKFVDSYWVAKFPAVLRNAEQVNKRDVIKVAQFLERSDRENFSTFTTHIGVLLNHLDYMSFCAERAVCDAELVAAFYCKEIDAIRTAALPTLDAYQSKGIGIGVNAINYFGKKCAGQPGLAAAAQ